MLNRRPPSPSDGSVDPQLIAGLGLAGRASRTATLGTVSRSSASAARAPLADLAPPTRDDDGAAAGVGTAAIGTIAVGIVGWDEGVLPAARSEMVNRVLNIVIAGIALLILAPVCVLVALAVKLTSTGPVFYTQTRVGLDRRWHRLNASAGERRIEDLGGQPFTILKFRSMRTDAEANGQAVWATKQDSRVTPVGQILRKTRLDEIPQLINVLRGEMNIVGPRPERPSIVVRLREHIPEYTQRHRVKPGITGWAQINHSYDACLEDVRTKVTYDLQYIGSQGLWFDVKIMCRTLPVMVFKRGAH